MIGWVKAADRALQGIVVLLFAMIFVFSITQVFFRYILNAPFSWGEELVRFVNVWCVFLAAGYGVAKGAHFGIAFFTSKLPMSFQVAIQVLVNLLVLVLCVFLVYSGVQLVTKTMSTDSQMLRIPFGLVYMAIPAGFCLIGLFTILEMLKIFGVKSSAPMERGDE